MLGGKRPATDSLSDELVNKRKNPEEEKKGADLYKNLKKHLLTPKQLEIHGYPRPQPEGSSSCAVLLSADAKRPGTVHNPNKTCRRCKKSFRVNEEGHYERVEQCSYHWGRPYNQRDSIGLFNKQFNCCTKVKPCQIASRHVHEGNDNPHQLEGFVRTTSKSPPSDGNPGIFALDCEMVYTAHGKELARVTVVNHQLKVVYEAFVKPPFPIVDYNTHFSGLTEEMLRGVSKSRSEVQTELLTLFSVDSILIGHSLQHDLLQVKLIHDTIVDTSVVFPHRRGLPYKRALRSLVKDHLGRTIQERDGGHDSAEDARSCLELMIWKVKHQRH